MTVPSVGHMVHYVGPADTDPPCAAAIVTAVNGAACSLQVFLPGQTFEAHGIVESESRERGTWHWPERVE